MGGGGGGGGRYLSGRGVLCGVMKQRDVITVCVKVAS